MLTMNCATTVIIITSILILLLVVLLLSLFASIVCSTTAIVSSSVYSLQFGSSALAHVCHYHFLVVEQGMEEWRIEVVPNSKP